ncbi:hypothetical protein FSP39_006016 [Pinctada imbricata]|uniref:26S proteasome non-ATPase regulatory subunit 9 n=1 Tax=Pinctada imbricata TaxID=66713 RepID=A0AA89C8Q4_PINIB|nr:hypothetical protein FSP39_006016 [Pinctada imbricata]
MTSGRGNRQYGGVDCLFVSCLSKALVTTHNPPCLLFGRILLLRLPVLRSSEDAGKRVARQKGVGMKEPLIDTEGYPRADIDVYTVRHARHKISCLQNDHKDVMKEIEEELYKIHAEARQKKAESMEEDDGQSAGTSGKEELLPFATVDRVDDRSPASNAGLEAGDEILSFGSVTCNNFQNMSNIASVVQHSKDKPLNVKVRRKGKDFNVSLTPQTWNGRELLGYGIIHLNLN